jgi:predicted AAA+ superfamily ATPase
LKSEDFRMPVGRVQYLYLYPLSFGEFLDATGETALRTYISDYAKLGNLPEGIHEKLTELVRKYYFIGGMPAVVNEYVTTGDIIKCQRIQRSIIDTYTDDFAKYARISRHDLLRNILNSVPAMVGQKFVYTQIDKNTKSRDIKAALEMLETAGILTRVRQTSGSGLPLSANVHESFFKIIFLDIGLFHAISGIYSETVRETDLTAIFKGAVAEQFAGQELVAYMSRYSRAGLYYWGRQEKNSTAEVDYLIEKDGKIIPVEIKSGSKGHLKSMHIFIEKYKSETALKISQARFESGNPIVSLPFYAIESFLKTGKTTA